MPAAKKTAAGRAKTKVKRAGASTTKSTAKKSVKAKSRGKTLETGSRKIAGASAGSRMIPKAILAKVSEVAKAQNITTRAFINNAVQKALETKV